MVYTLRNDNFFTESAVMERLTVWLTILSGSLAIALWTDVEALHPGVVAQMPSMLQSLGEAIVEMLRHFADSGNAMVRNIVIA